MRIDTWSSSTLAASIDRYEMTVRIIRSLTAVSAEQWNALQLGGNPFLRHEFLLALEQQHCIGRDTGWVATHLLLEDHQGVLLGAVPLYLKSHSWGEFVFDWSWAKAYAQSGLDYYPKLVSIAPFTPVPGARLLTRGGDDTAEIRLQLIRALIAFATEASVSSIHVLFATEAERQLLAGESFLLRKDCQFHWHNHGFRSFDEFMATFRSEKRKKALRERRRIQEGGVTFKTLHGADMTPALWTTVFGFSAATFEQRGHEHYLNEGFFRGVSSALPDAVMVKLAMHGDRPIASAIFFRSHDTLYGRYWGAAAEFDSLHFETCYYQGIDYCIEQGLLHFEPGTQGEHKVARGFEPTATWSAHWIADPRFRRAIDQYLGQERSSVDAYLQSVREHLPFRRDESGNDPSARGQSDNSGRSD
jgi:predicted N-acyltransferase